MYKITCENFTICETDNPELICQDVSLSRELNYAGLLKFGMTKIHPYYENVGTGQIIRCYIDKKLVFTGEITSSKSDLKGTKTISAMGLLYKFSQTVQNYSANQNYTLLEFITKVIDYHNSQIGSKWQIKIGNITVTDPNDNIYRGLSYETTQDVFKYKLMEQLGGYLQIREYNEEFYLDYLVDYTNINSQGLHFGENIIKLNLSKAHENIYNVIFPVGKKINTETEERVTIASVNGGKLTIKDEDSVKAFGERVLSVQYNDVTEPSNLLAKAYEDLNKHKDLLWQFDFTAIDLAKININYKAFSLGDYTPISIPIHGIDTISQITGIDDDLSNPTRSKIYCGKKVKTSSGNKVQADNVINKINSSYVTNQTVTEKIDDNNATIYPLIQENSAAIIETAANIRTEVSTEYTTKGETIAMQETIFDQTNSQFSFIENELNTNVLDLEDKINTNQTYVTSMVRIDGGDIDMSRTDSPFSVTVGYDDMTYFESGVPGTTINHDTIKTDHGIFLETSQLCDLQVFRQSNGNNSIIWVERS